jgi:hypothetical protein
VTEQSVEHSGDFDRTFVEVGSRDLPKQTDISTDDNLRFQLEGRSASDHKEVRFVRSRPSAATLRDVAQDGYRRAPHLLCDPELLGTGKLRGDPINITRELPRLLPYNQISVIAFADDSSGAEWSRNEERRGGMWMIPRRPADVTARHGPLPTAHCALPTAHCALPTAHCPLRTRIAT